MDQNGKPTELEKATWDFVVPIWDKLVKMVRDREAVYQQELVMLRLKLHRAESKLADIKANRRRSTPKRKGKAKR